MQCKLCLRNNVALCKSHIIPEFLYKQIYDDKDHLYFVMPTNPNIRPSRRRKGIYEELFCKDCELLLQKYENYASKVIYGGTAIPINKFSWGYSTTVDYSLFKLFQISLIWRAGASNRKEFKSVNLNKHAEKMRIMLLNEQPGKPYEYGCILLYLPSAHEIMQQMILIPEQTPKKIQGHTCYRAILGGMFWSFLISNHLKEFPHKQWFLNSSGELKIFHGKGPASAYLINISKEFIDTNKDFFKTKKI